MENSDYCNRAVPKTLMRASGGILRADSDVLERSFFGRVQMTFSSEPARVFQELRTIRLRMLAWT